MVAVPKDFQPSTVIRVEGFTSAFVDDLSEHINRWLRADPERELVAVVLASESYGDPREELVSRWGALVTYRMPWSHEEAAPS